MSAVLLIGGTDSSGGAGLVRDVQVLTQFGVDALCVVTAVTAQSDARVTAIHHIPPAALIAQIDAAFVTRQVDAIKIGMLGTRATIEAVIEGLVRNRDNAPSPARPIVLDPVLVSSSGAVLLDEEGRNVLRELLLPRTTLLTPNLLEAAALLGDPPAIDDEARLEQAQRLLAMGPHAVLLKGGHAQGPEAIDWLVERGAAARRLAAPRVAAARRGTGCTLASVIAAGLAQGKALSDACEVAKKHITAQLAGAPPHRP